MKRLSIVVLTFFYAVQILFAQHSINSVNHEPKYYPVRERILTQSLNGTWKIKTFEGLEIPTELANWKEPTYDDTSWHNIEVPGNWETQGLKTPEYGSAISEYTGLYRKTFDYNPTWKDKYVILRFDGVHFGYEVFVNGQKVGQWGNAYNLCQFNITPYLYSDKKNSLSVKVTTRSMGWKFDTNDCWGLAGITRDVELFTVNNTYLEDVTFVSDINTDLSASIRIRADINSFYPEHKNLHFRITVSDPQNNHIIGFTRILKEGVKSYQFEGQIKQPLLWTAETPNLYRLQLCIVDDKDNIVQRVNEYVGLRSVSVEGFDLKINHRPILLRGVCLNEIDPKSGRALTFEERRAQLLKMKAAHINFIRTAHYPFAPDFLKLCDEMGFYVCNEVPFGARGAEHLSDKQFIPELQARADATICRDKNHPSVIMWSVGNENPFTPMIGDLLKRVKEKDPTRPRGLPQKLGDFMKFVEKPDENVDIVMGHYLNDARIDQAVKVSRKPIIHTEYAHSMGNAFNDFEGKFARILNEEKVIGGSIWCWSDQAVLTNGKIKNGYSEHPDTLQRDARRDLSTEYQGVWIDQEHFMDTFGDRGADGIVYADGYPKEAYYLVRKSYSPVTVLTSSLKGRLNTDNNFTIELENRFDFISLRGHQLKWQVKNLQNILDEGAIWLETSAREKEKINVKIRLPQNLELNDAMLCIEVFDPIGKQIYEHNLPIVLEGNEKRYLSFTKFETAKGKMKNRISKSIVSSSNGMFNYTISEKGIFSILTAKGNKIVETPLLLRVGRSETMILKTQQLKKGAFNWNPYLLKPVVEKFSVQKKDGGILATLFCRWNRNNEISDQYVSGEVNIFFAPNEKIQFDYNLKPSQNSKGNFLESGLTLEIGSSFHQFSWLGDGPYSSTPGKSALSERNIWRLHRDDIHFNGNKKNVDIGIVTNENQGIAIVCDNDNIGLENIEGSVFISQNAIVAGYGTKFMNPIGMVSMEDLVIKGSFSLFAENLERLSPLIVSVFKSFPIVVPEKPYIRTYGW